MSTLFENVVQQYAEYGVDVESALDTLFATPISIHCWQGDDINGSENAQGDLSGSGLATTGNYPGKARNPVELRQDLDKALSLIPGRNRINLHACYPDRVIPSRDRDAYEVDQFQDWIGWAKENQLGMDFNPSCFAHPKASDGFTLTHKDPAIRTFWMHHCEASRRIAQEIGKQLGSCCINNLWIPDGMKDLPADRLHPRQKLLEALDEIFKESLNPDYTKDSVESKLFGIGSEAYVVGSHEFYLGYATSRQKVLCLDAGHFHPTETLADKISSTLLYVPELLLHVSRGVRWDSDHVVLLDDPTKAVMEEIVRGEFLSRVHIGLDYFDASINRIAAWVIGTRNTQKALLQALLEPRRLLTDYELNGDYTSRLALMEDGKTLPFGEVWEEFCRRSHTPGDRQWIKEIKNYEHAVLSHRNG